MEISARTIREKYHPGRKGVPSTGVEAAVEGVVEAECVDAEEGVAVDAEDLVEADLEAGVGDLAADTRVEKRREGRKSKRQIEIVS